MTDLKFFGGVNEIGGTKILVNDQHTKLMLDFGVSFSTWGKFFEEYMKPRYSSTGLKDLFAMGLLPDIEGFYRSDLLGMLGRDFHPEPEIDAVLLSHIHQDHSTFITVLDERIPVFCSEPTVQYSITMLRAGQRGLENEIFNFKTRPIPRGKKDLPDKERTVKTVQSGKPFKIDEIEVTPYGVDHSVSGALGFIVETSDKTIAYTGDLRLHGSLKKLTLSFAEKSGAHDVDILLCEGTRIDEHDERTEEYVKKEAFDKVNGCKQLVVADYAFKDLDRFLTFYSVANETGRQLVITKKQAHLLRGMQGCGDVGLKLPEITEKSLLIYKDVKEQKTWEKEFLELPNAVDADYVHQHQSEVILSLSFLDLNELIDLNPSPGSVYIHSMSEPHSEEQQIDQKRMNNWLEHFQLKKYGIHASGHANGDEIKEIIEMIKPKKIMPVHTEKPELFRELHGNVELPKLETHP